MNYTDRKTANTVGGKTARACDSCLRKRARWYCAADDAFLCQSCDSSVHSANQLANRHKRVRLETSSNKPSESKTLDNDSVPAWHQGFTRKARTPRHPKPAQKDKDGSVNVCASPLVPDLGTEDSSFEETEAQLLYRVPVFDSFAAELCNVSNEMENIHADYKNEPLIRNHEPNVLFSDSGNDGLDYLPVFLPSDMELAEFAADVESLLGTGLDEESCGIEGLGLIDCKEENEIDDCFEGRRVKIEHDEEVQAIIACHFDPGLDLSRETLDWNFDYESPVVTGEEEEEEKVVVVVEAEAEMLNGESNEMRKKKFLRLNYEEVIVAWDNQGCPWTSGIRPEFNPDDCWPDFMGMNAPGSYHPYGSSGRRMGCGSDGGREARVSRYREKRRTRLFSKKIRYEVRKLNAEKRPRMKGRFVKRTSFAGGSTNIPSYLMNK